MKQNVVLLALCKEAATASTDDCILVGSRTRPQISVDGHTMTASRAVWLFAHGDPGRAQVLHTCDDEQCINIRHLYLGDAKQNMKDVLERSTTYWENMRATRPRGEAHPSAKLSAEDVLIIRSSTDTVNALARQFGVHKKTIAAAQGRGKVRPTWQSNT